MTDQLWTLPQVAHFLQISVERFYRQRRALEGVGLPPPVFGRARGARWDPEGIRAWLARRRTCHGSDIEAFEAAHIDAILDARAEHIAKGGRV